MKTSRKNQENTVQGNIVCLRPFPSVGIDLPYFLGKYPPRCGIVAPSTIQREFTEIPALMRPIIRT